MNDYTFKSTIKDTQNRLVAESIRDTSNAELLKSEEALRAIFKSYSDRFKSAEGSLFELAKYIVTSKTPIKTSYFNELFETIYIDLSTLYTDIGIVGNILDLSESRQKSYFLVIKKRMRDLWNKLTSIRNNIHDSNPVDESFFESFNGDIAPLKTKNVVIDKKLGYLHLEPQYKRTFNQSYQIKSVTSTTYPVNYDEGGVNITTNILNTFSDNYTNGPRDMLENGLWKEEVICTDIPDMTLSIDGSGFYKQSFRGIVSIVDIEFLYPIELNRLDIDFFGEFSTNINHVLFKNTEDATWEPLKYQLDQDIGLTKDASEIKGSEFDLITFYNIEYKKVKFLRIVFNQEHYTALTSESSPEDDVNQRIMDDLSERRYELIKFGSSIDSRLSTPVNDENSSLYYTVVNIIETNRDVGKILEKINEVLNPNVNITIYDFSERIKFELGAWSIEPKIEKYTSWDGIYDSKFYTLEDRGLIAASLQVSQETPGMSTCNWYISTGSKDVPILPFGINETKEPLNVIDMSSFSNYNSWIGSFVLLDFPIDPSYADYVSLYYDSGTPYELQTDIVYLNSRLLFFPDIVSASRKNITIRYIPAKYESVNLYSLILRSNITRSNNFELGIVSTRKEILSSFCKELTYNEIYFDSLYIVSSAISTKPEAEGWFGTGFSNALFIDETLFADLQINSNFNKIASQYNQVLSTDTTKLRSTYSDAILYANGTSAGSSDLALISGIKNIAPLTIMRNIK